MIQAEISAQTVLVLMVDNARLRSELTYRNLQHSMSCSTSPTMQTTVNISPIGFLDYLAYLLRILRRLWPQVVADVAIFFRNLIRDMHGSAQAPQTPQSLVYS